MAVSPFLRRIRRRPGVISFVAALRRTFESAQVRIGLSLAIIVSILPVQRFDESWWLFFGLFSLELVARILLLVLRNEGGHRDRRSRILELGFLALDLLALLSFLPIDTAVISARYLRIVRLSRLLLLVGYWGPTVATLGNLLLRRERRQQLWFMAIVTTLLSLISAILLHHFAHSEIEALLHRKVGFFDIVWWSFQQIEDPGNLVQEPASWFVVIVSVALTMAGIFLVSFVIGIGTTIVAEMVRIGRDQPSGLRNHSVLINLTPYSHFFLDEVVRYYRKQLARPRWILLGQDPEAPKYLADPQLRQFVYRHGNSYHTEDLAKTDVAGARRIVIQGNESAPDSDAETVSSILSVRRENPDAWVIAEIASERNLSAALRAGGQDHTVIVPTDQFTALFLAKLVHYPELQPLLTELISTEGDEIYTHIFEEPFHLPSSPIADPIWFSELFRYAYRNHEIILLGLARHVGSAIARGGFRIVLPDGSGGEPEPARAPIALRGICGLSDRYQNVKQLCEEFVAAGFRMAEPKRAPHPQLERCELRFAQPTPQKILFGSFDPSLVELVEQVLQNNPQTELFFMLKDEIEIAYSRTMLLQTGSNLKRFEDIHNPSARGRGEFFEIDAKQIGYRAPSGEETPARIRFLLGDASSRHDLLGPNEFDFVLEQMDQIGFISEGRRGGDPDARTVLALLKILNLRQSRLHRDRFKPDLRIIAGMKDVLKGELLEHRFEGDPDIASVPITIVSTEKIRNFFLFQSVVVPGFGQVYREILDHVGDDLVAAELDAPDEIRENRITFSDLLLHLQATSGSILLGVAIRSRADNCVTSYLNPKPGTAGHEFRISDIAALFLIASSEARAAG